MAANTGYTVLKKRTLAASGTRRLIPTGAEPSRPPERKPPARETGGDPKLELLKNDDGTVTHMHVKCPCGRELMLECDYSPEE